MERINHKIWSYYNAKAKGCSANNTEIRNGSGHFVNFYLELAGKVAELQFFNRDYILLFRGQGRDYLTNRQNSMIKSSIFRNKNNQIPKKNDMDERFEDLCRAEDKLLSNYSARKLTGLARLKRHRIVRWAILQHYEVCSTPLLDVTHSLRIAASFASNGNNSDDAFIFAFGVPNLSGATTASSEAGMQIVRLSSACPPDAIRPHIQEGYLLGEYPEIGDTKQSTLYRIHEMDFGRRLIAKFRFCPKTFWCRDYQPVSDSALYPTDCVDPLCQIANEIKESLDEEAA